jgi:phosphoribosylanthranilate isomerase
MTVRVKICGITNVPDAHAAVRAGADALGFLLSESPRQVTPRHVRAIVGSLPPFVQAVGVFVDEPVETVSEMARAAGVHCLQLQGAETPDYCGAFSLPVIKTFRVRDSIDPAAIRRYAVAAYLFDTAVAGAAGGTGESFDWEVLRAAEFARPVILAGGLRAENVARAVAAVAPYAVDVSSGVAAGPRRKDPEKIRGFISRAKQLQAPWRADATKERDECCVMPLP